MRQHRTISASMERPHSPKITSSPAACDTLSCLLRELGAQPTDFDCIVTGDLGKIGHAVVTRLFQDDGVDLEGLYTDCGLLIYDLEGQDVHAGGSGCGCSAGVLCGHILNRMDRGELKNILFMATGALMSTTSSQQGESIPGIAHLVHVGRG